VSRYQKGKTNLDLLKQESEWQWHQLGCMQVCILLQTENHASVKARKALAQKIGEIAPRWFHQTTPKRCFDFSVIDTTQPFGHLFCADLDHV